VGYDRDPNTGNFIVCRFGADEVVRVGTKHTAYWIDRYEASVWERSDGSGKSYGPPGEDYPLPKNGQLAAINAYAVSKAFVQPAISITWFQADALCRASGKRLPSSSEWGYAASGTPDPGASGGEGGYCRTAAADLRLTSHGAYCTSFWGAQDMVGNASEWTADWFAAPPVDASQLPTNTAPWGASYGNDSTTNVVSWAGMAAGWTRSVPGGLNRGGSIEEGESAGVFNINVSVAPNNGYYVTGFRCIIPR
jgi:formylglycine-generating enzyme required for sulfatase activity